MLVLKSFKLVNYAYFNSYTKYIQAHRFTYKGYCMDVYGLVQFAFPKKKIASVDHISRITFYPRHVNLCWSSAGQQGRNKGVVDRTAMELYKAR